MMNLKKEFITIKEAAEILSVSRDTLRRWDKVCKLKTKRHPMNNFRINVKHVKRQNETKAKFTMCDTN
jgi:excisionase family DNA binding protein